MSMSQRTVRRVALVGALFAAAIAAPVDRPAVAQEATRPAVAPPFPGAYLAKNADLFIHVRLADGLKDPFVKPFLGGQYAIFDQAFEGVTGLKFSDVESVTMSAPAFATVQREIGKRRAIASADGTEPPAMDKAFFDEMVELVWSESVFVVRLKKDFDPATAKQNGKRLVADGEPMGAVGGLMYVAEQGSPLKEVVLWMPNARTVVAGLTQPIVDVAVQFGAAPRRTGFAGVRPGTLVVAFAPEDGFRSLPDLPENTTGALGNERSAKEYDTLRQSLAGMTLTVDLDADLPTLTAVMPALRPGDSGTMAELDTLMDDALSQIRGSAGKAGEAVPPPFGQYAKQFIESGVKSRANGVFALKFTVPAELRAMFTGQGR